jgi:hypothetical protein
MSQPPFLRIGTRFEVRRPAGTVHVPGKGDFPDRFAPGTFDAQVGSEISLSVNGEPVGRAVIIAVQVADDGSSVLLTYEITELGPGQEDDTNTG